MQSTEHIPLILATVAPGAQAGVTPAEEGKVSFHDLFRVGGGENTAPDRRQSHENPYPDATGQEVIEQEVIESVLPMQVMIPDPQGATRAEALLPADHAGADSLPADRQADPLPTDRQAGPLPDAVVAVAEADAPKPGGAPLVPGALSGDTVSQQGQVWPAAVRSAMHAASSPATAEVNMQAQAVRHVQGAGEQPRNDIITEVRSVPVGEVMLPPGGEMAELGDVRKQGDLPLPATKSGVGDSGAGEAGRFPVMNARGVLPLPAASQPGDSERLSPVPDVNRPPGQHQADQPADIGSGSGAAPENTGQAKQLGRNMIEVAAVLRGDTSRGHDPAVQKPETPVILPREGGGTIVDGGQARVVPVEKGAVTGMTPAEIRAFASSARQGLSPLRFEAGPLAELSGGSEAGSFTELSGPPKEAQWRAPAGMNAAISQPANPPGHPFSSSLPQEKPDVGAEQMRGPAMTDAKGPPDLSFPRPTMSEGRKDEQRLDSGVSTNIPLSLQGLSGESGSIHQKDAVGVLQALNTVQAGQHEGLVSGRQEIPLMRHVAAQITAVAQPLPQSPIELTLNPEELGRVKLGFQIENGIINVIVQADRPETLDLMRRHADLLTQDLRQIGYRDVNIGFGQRGAGGHDGQPGHGGAHSSAPAPISQEEPTTTHQPTQPQARPGNSLAGATGIDIRY